MEQDNLVTGGGAVAQFRAAQARIIKDFPTGKGVKPQDMDDLQAGLDGAALAVLLGGEDIADLPGMQNWVSQLHMGL
jgi:hypothetical protein